jgi:predicted ATP-dependent Lon-type protease
MSTITLNLHLTDELAEKLKIIPNLDDYVLEMLADRFAYEEQEAKNVGEICKERLQGKFTSAEEAIVKRLQLRESQSIAHEKTTN